MKILQVIDTLAVGGAEKILVTLANIQHRKGEKVSVLTLLEPGELSKQLNEAIPLYSLNRKFKFSLITFYKFIQIARKFDIIHVHSAHNLRYVFLASLLFRLNKTIIFHEHSGKALMTERVKWDRRFIYPKIWTVGVSSKLCNWVTTKVGAPSKRVFLLPNIIEQKAYLRRRNINSQCIKILFTGNIIPRKNLNHAIEVFGTFRQDTKASLLVVGRVADAEYFSEVSSKVHQLGLQNDVVFIHDCNDIQGLASECDLALHSATSESGPLVLIEYLAQGLPFVAFDTGEIVRLVKNEFPEFIVADFDKSTWIQRMKQLLRSTTDGKRQQLRSFYENNFSEETYYERCRKIYETALPS